MIRLYDTIPLHYYTILYFYAPGTADRVSLGLIPSSEAGWPLAVRALKPTGGWLHVHANVSSVAGEEAKWADELQASSYGLGRVWVGCG
jgi:tRNA G37 N-methylase Trm5